MSNLVKRSLSGAVFIAVITGSILLGSYACAAVMAAVVVWAMLEFCSIVARDGVRVSRFFGVLFGVSLFAASFFYARGAVSSRVFLFLVPLTVLYFISQLYAAGRYPFRSIAYTVAGAVYTALPFAFFTGMMFPPVDGRLPHPDGGYMPDLLLGFFALLWTNDTFAYLTGMLFGRHRLFERISPKKTWEGFIGGMVCTVLLSFPAARCLPVLSLYHWMAVALIIVVFGVYGDLTESLLKRSMSIKDSGHFLPGHGGILDRFDAVLLAAPMVYFYLMTVVF